MGEALSKTDKINKINGIFLGIAAVMNFAVGTVSDYIAISNLFPLSMIALGIVAVLTNILYGQLKWSVSAKEFVFVFVFTVQVLVGVILGKSSNSIYYAQCFLCIGIPSLFLATRKIDYDILRHTILIVAIGSISHFISILSREYTIYTSGEQMGNAYSILVILFIAGWTLFDSNDSTLWKIVSILIAAICSSILVKVMTRGAWLCVFAFLGYLLWKKTKSKRLFLVIVISAPLLVIAIWIVFTKYISHSEWFANIFSLKAGDLLNGRSNLLEYGFSYRGVLKTIFGSGIGAFYGIYHTYPHNLFAQLYYDQGLIALLTVVCIFIPGCKGLMHNAVNGQKSDCFLILVICAGLVKLMVSSYFWIEQLFWIMMGLILNRSMYQAVLREGQEDE